MSSPNPARGRKPKPKIKSQDIRGAKYLEQILDVLASLHDHKSDLKRQLHYDEYCAWLLLYFFTPALDSMRGLQQVSGLKQIRRKLRLPRFSLGSFSEAGCVFDPELLVPIMEQIEARLGDIESDTRLRGLNQRPTAVDGTLLHALPKMVWALWRDEHNHAAKLHLQFDLLKGAPYQAELTCAQESETRALERQLEAGRLYVQDRGYFDFDLMASILKKGSSFVLRVRDNIVHEVVETKPISAAAAKVGVEADLIVRAGFRDPLELPLRLIRIKGEDSTCRVARVDSKTKSYRTHEIQHTLLLLTDRLDLDAELIGVLYRHRWQIELFFRWFKKVLQADKLLSLSENGMTIVVYCALIASMLVSLWSGRKPTKRTFEMICFYFSGWADEEELREHLLRLEPVKTTS